VTLYAVGLGQTAPGALTNVLGTFDQRLQAPLALGFGSIATQDLVVTLSRQFISVYEIEVTIPATADLGTTVPLGLQIAPTGLGPFFAQDNLTIAITNP